MIKATIDGVLIYVGDMIYTEQWCKAMGYPTYDEFRMDLITNSDVIFDMDEVEVDEYIRDKWENSEAMQEMEAWIENTSIKYCLDIYAEDC